MQLSDKIKKFSVEQAIDYLNKNPVKNLPKLLDWADTFCAGKFEGQRRAIRKACLDPTDAHYPMVQYILNDVDPGVRKTTLVNFFIYGISSCYTSVNWDAISSEEYFRQLIDLGCLFIWYSHYMPVGSDASPSRQPPQPRRSKERAQKPTRARTQKSSASRSGSAAFRAFSSSRRLGVRVRRGARHRRRWRKPRTASNKKHRLPVGRRCFCTHAVVTTRCRTPARAR